MNDPLDRLDQVLQTLEKELDVYDRLVEEHARAEAKYRSLKAQTWLEVKVDSSLKTAGDRNAFVDNKLEAEYLAFRLAEGKDEAQKERTRTLRTLLSGLQTMNSAGRV